MRLNIQAKEIPSYTHEGGRAASHVTPEQQLRRSVLSCLLWEREFYEDGVSIADRIEALCEVVPPLGIANLAVEARSSFHLRHVPLLLLSNLARRGAGTSLVSETIAKAIQRADELTEFLAIYWRKGKTPVSKQVKLGLGMAFAKFNEYSLAKYDRANVIRLRDVMFLARPKPKDEEQAALWKRLADQELAIPDTWEVALSGGADKKETFERLLREGKLGYLALLRNLRNMMQAGCDVDLVRTHIRCRENGANRVLPFRYVAAARACPQLEPDIDVALNAAISDMPRLSGKTIVLVDVSGSMRDKLSARSDLTRMDAAAALASIINGEVRMFSFSNRVVEVPPRRGMAGVDALLKSQPHSGTALFEAVAEINAKVPHDRLIVITDEQAHGTWNGSSNGGAVKTLPDPLGLGYMINVASAQNGVGYGKWVHIDGFSEQVLRFIGEHEQQDTLSGSQYG